MRVCDRHPRKKAVETVLLKSTDSQFDLCTQCTEKIAKFISDVKKDDVEAKRNFLGRKSA